MSTKSKLKPENPSNELDNFSPGDKIDQFIDDLAEGQETLIPVDNYDYIPVAFLKSE